jgi:hypothetical protein
MLNIPREVDDEIRACCRGRRPRTKAEYERVASRFDCAVRFYPHPFRASQSTLQDGVIHVPDITADSPVTAHHIHELAEACTRWEGCPPCIAPVTPCKDARHEVARAVNLLEPRRCLTNDLQMRIARMSSALASLVDRAGYQYIGVTVIGDGKSSYKLEYREN